MIRVAMLYMKNPSNNNKKKGVAILPGADNMKGPLRYRIDDDDDDEDQDSDVVSSGEFMLDDCGRLLVALFEFFEICFKRTCRIINKAKQK